ncbi:hypothetical protein QJS10_CPA01g01114 [Acorus calamus]|uniref:Uncharacterized protein n=1 Tax=Acorus calamus TaxID=4465 RepID=A0AAV9FK85_ACOCL|nr:hypothetical protein QJS10_CPA01g01114 [Acorus calamus]
MQESLSSKEVAMEGVQVVRLLNRYEHKGKRRRRNAGEETRRGLTERLFHEWFDE